MKKRQQRPSVDNSRNEVDDQECCVSHDVFLDLSTPLPTSISSYLSSRQQNPTHPPNTNQSNHNPQDRIARKSRCLVRRLRNCRTCSSGHRYRRCGRSQSRRHFRRDSSACRSRSRQRCCARILKFAIPREARGEAASVTAPAPLISEINRCAR